MRPLKVLQLKQRRTQQCCFASRDIDNRRSALSKVSTTAFRSFDVIVDMDKLAVGLHSLQPLFRHPPSNRWTSEVRQLYVYPFSEESIEQTNGKFLHEHNVAMRVLYVQTAND